MDRKLINPLIVTGIADAVRAKGKTTEPIKVADLPNAIMNLPEGGGVGEDTGELLDAIGVESREDTGMANGLAQALTDSATEQMWSGERTTADGEPIKDGVAFVSALKGKTMKVNQIANIDTTTLRGVTITNNGDGSYTLNGTATANTNAILCDLTPYENGQKFLFALKTTNPKLCLYESSNGKKSVTNEIYTRAIGRRYGLYIEEGATFSNEKITFLAVHLNAVGMESITTADQFANAFGYATIADLPPIPYTPTTNLQSFAPKAIVSKKDGVELGRLPFDLTTIVDAQGNQLFPDGELKSAGSVADEVDYANGLAEASFDIIDLGKLNWTTYMTDKHLYQARITNTNHYNGAMLSVRYNKGTNAFADLLNLQIRSSQSNPSLLVLRDDAYDTPEALKASLNGQILLYEYKEHLTAQFTPTKSWYPVQTNGAEEAITDTIVPMNAEIRYRVDTESLLAQSASLLRYSNEVTGANDTSLGDAVKTLTDSYK